MRHRSLGLLLSLLAVSCSAQSRLWRIFPWSDADATDPERMNLFPLAYVDSKEAAVLWPLTDFDDHGFAVRPLVAKDDDVVDVLFPLSHLDLESGEGWALNGYSLNDNVGLFPLCNFGPTFNFCTLAYWWRDGEQVTDWGFFPLAHRNVASGDGYFLTAYEIGDSSGIFPLYHSSPGFSFVGPAWWCPSAGTENGAFGLFPLFTCGDLNQYGLVWWTDAQGGDAGSFGLFPLVWGDRGGERFGVLPLYYQDLDPKHQLHVALLPPTWWETEGDVEHHVVFPFYFHFADAAGTSTAFLPFFLENEQPGSSQWYSLIGNGWQSAGASGLNLYPLYWSEQTADSSRSMLVPFYLYREHGDERELITPLGGRGWDASGATRFVNVLGPIYHHTIDADRSTTSVLWPLYSREESSQGSDTWMAAGLSRYVTAADSDATSFRLWPLWGSSDAGVPPDPLFDWAIVSRQLSGEEWSNHLFPLYAANGDADRSSFTTLVGLAHVGTTPEGSSWRLWPLASGSTDEAADGWIDRLTLFRHEERGETSRSWLLPIYFGERGPGVDRDEFLFSLARRVESDAGSTWRVWPLVSASTSVAEGSPGLHDVVDWCTLVGLDRRPERTHFHAGTPLLFDYEREGEQLQSWDVRALALITAGHEERPAASDAPTCIERNHAGFLFDWFKAERKVVQEPGGTTHPESHYRLPFLQEYESEPGRTEWDLLCWAVHSEATPAEEKFSVLGYAYRSTTTPTETHRDIFPAITYDKTPDASRFSFLWRLFRYERHGEKSGGHIFFIPWGDAG